MPNGREGIAQAFYLAQLQACKGSCKCNVCQLLRKSADSMTQDVLNPSPGTNPNIQDMINQISQAGYSVSPPASGEES